MGNLLDVNTSCPAEGYDLSGKTSRQLCDYCVKNKIANVKIFNTYCIVNTLFVPCTPYTTTVGMFYFDKYPSAKELLVQLMEYKALKGKIVNSVWIHN